jgi:hypothetical protein
MELTIKEGDTCSAEALAEQMWYVPDLIQDWKKSSSRGRARMALTLMEAHIPGADVDYITSGILEEINGNPVDEKPANESVLGYDNRVANMAKLDSWYKVYELSPSASAAGEEDEHAVSNASSPTSKADEDVSSPANKADEGTATR